MNEELKVVISAEVSQFKKSVSDAKKSIKDFVDVGKTKLDAFNTELQKYGKVANNVLKSTAGVATGLATALLGTAVATSDYREAQAKLTTAFESAGSSAEQAKATYNDLYKVLGDSDVAVEASAHLGKLTQDQQALSEWTNICQGVYATFGDSLPIEGLTEASNETAKTGELTGGLADALNWAGVNEDVFKEKLSACSTEAEREALIRGTLNGLYSEASAKYAENNEQILAQNEANQKMNDAMAKLGEVMAPINTMLAELGAEILTQLTPYIEDFADKYLPTIKEVLAGVGEKIGECLTWISEHWDTITTIGGIILGVSVAVSAVSTAVGILNTIVSANPIALAIGVIIGALALGIYYWDELKAGAQYCIEGITNWVNGLKETITNKFNGIKDAITGAINKAKDGVKSAIDKIKGFFNFDWKLPKIKLPHFSISGEFSLNPPSIPHFGVSWYAKGGVFDTPTLFGYGNGSIGGLGEAGAEAVVPLEKNTQWLDKIAQRLQGETKTLVLMVDGKVFGEVAVDSINGITAQRGSIPLRLV